MRNPMAGRARKVALALAASGVASLAMTGSAMAGAFVISPQTVKAPTVYFWGAQWSQYNQVKGDVPSSFKGYTDTFDSSSLGGCASSSAVKWQTDPGSSTPPPATLNVTLPLDQLTPTAPDGDPLALVITADTISKNGSTITGSDSKGAQVFLVDVTSNYAPDAGHVGVGTIFAPICNAADIAAAQASSGQYGGSVNLN